MANSGTTIHDPSVDLTPATAAALPHPAQSCASIPRHFLYLLCLHVAFVLSISFLLQICYCSCMLDRCALCTRTFHETLGNTAAYQGGRNMHIRVSEFRARTCYDTLAISAAYQGVAIHACLCGMSMPFYVVLCMQALHTCSSCSRATAAADSALLGADLVFGPRCRHSSWLSPVIALMGSPALPSSVHARALPTMAWASST